MARVLIGRSEDLGEREALRFRVRRGGEEKQAFAVRFDGQVHAYLNVCTHRNLELDLGGGAFFAADGMLLQCRAHGALYHPADGTCAGGICRRGAALSPVRVIEEDGLIFAQDEP